MPRRGIDTHVVMVVSHIFTVEDREKRKIILSRASLVFTVQALYVAVFHRTFVKYFRLYRRIAIGCGGQVHKGIHAMRHAEKASFEEFVEHSGEGNSPTRGMPKVYNSRTFHPTNCNSAIAKLTTATPSE